MIEVAPSFIDSFSSCSVFEEYTNRLEDFEMREDNILPGIPSQPMGYGDAEHFLRQLSDITDSDEVPADWAGEIKGIRYKIGGTLPNQR